MDSNLHKIFLELDYKYDIDIEDYFKLTEEDREYIADVVTRGILSNPLLVPITIHAHLAVLGKLIRQYELTEEYEKCELFYRIEKKIFDSIENNV